MSKLFYILKIINVINYCKRKQHGTFRAVYISIVRLVRNHKKKHRLDYQNFNRHGCALNSILKRASFMLQFDTKL